MTRGSPRLGQGRAQGMEMAVQTVVAARVQLQTQRAERNLTAGPRCRLQTQVCDAAAPARRTAARERGEMKIVEMIVAPCHDRTAVRGGEGRGRSDGGRARAAEERPAITDGIIIMTVMMMVQVISSGVMVCIVDGITRMIRGEMRMIIVMMMGTVFFSCRS